MRYLVAGRTVILGRRRFLQVATAAGIATIASDRLIAAVLAESPSPAPVSDAIAGLAASLGNDPERIFRWVRDEIRYEPYPGLLRGANGTFLSRAGNSADQSSLLVELLRASSVPTRYVTGSLATTASDALVATSEMDLETARREIERAVLSESDIAAGIHPDVPSDDPPEAGLSPEAMAQITAAAEADQDVMGSVAKVQLDSAVVQLLTALGPAAGSLPMGVSVMPEQERARHVWVQADLGSGWLDMDPSLPAEIAGSGVGAPDTTLDALPDDLRHRIDFSVVAESFVGGGLIQEAILEWGAFADELAYQGVALTLVHPDAAPGVNFLGAGLSDAALYVPALIVDDIAHLARTAISIGGSGGGGGGLFGDSLGGGGGGLTDGEATAVWIEIRVTVPGSEPRVARRPIFDRIGRTIRDGGVVDPFQVPPAELVDLGSGQDAEYLPCGTVMAFSVKTGTMNQRSLLEGIEYRLPGAGSLLAAGWQGTRDQLRSELADTIGCLPFDDAPSVIAWVVTPTPDGAVARQDILHRTFGTVALSDRAPSAAPALVAGVLGHVAERMAAGDGLPSGDLAGTAPVSVGSLFQMAEDQGIPLRALRGDIPADLLLGTEPAALIGAALDTGSIVVVPERPLDVAGSPRVGWWIIDPLTGQAVDQLDTGGGELPEETEIVVVDSAEWQAARAMTQLRVGLIRNIVRAMVNDPTVSIQRLRVLERVLRFAAVRTLGA